MEKVDFIETITDYEEALNELWNLIERDPEPGSAAARRYDQLAEALRAYERRRYPVLRPMRELMTA